MTVIVLRRPIVAGGTTVDQLALREPTAGEIMRASAKSGRQIAIKLIAEVAGVSEEVAGALPARVSNQALAYLNPHLEAVLGALESVAPDEMPDELTIDLPATIQIGTAWVDRLVLREPTLAELDRADRVHGMARLIALVAMCSDQPRQVIERIPAGTFARAALFVAGFTQAVPAAGPA